MRRTWIRGLLLLAVFAVAFLIRAAAYNLPNVPAQEKPLFQDENGDPYLTEMDSYFYLRKAQEMADENRLVWSVDRNEDPLMGSRTHADTEGFRLPLGLSALAFLVWKAFLSWRGVSLTQTALWLGPVLGSLAVIPAFRYVRARTSLPGAVAAALGVGCAVPFALHTHAGFFDTDMVLAVLPLTALLSLMKCLQASSLKTQALRALLSAAAFAVFSLFWAGYYAYYLFAVLCTALTVLFCGLWALISPGRKAAGPKTAGQWKTVLRGGLLFLGLSFGLLFLFGGSGFIRTLLEAPSALRSAAGSEDAMPYALEQIVEMQPLRFLPSGSPLQWVKANTDSLFGRMGGIVPLLLALGWIPLEILRRKRKPLVPAEQPENQEDSLPLITEVIFLGLWAAGGMLLACRWLRFSEIPVLPVSLLCGLCVGRIYTLVRSRDGWKRKGLRAACAALAVCVMVPAAVGAWKAVCRSGPMMNDSKQAAMAWIRENLPEDTAIASWQDDGYYMEYAARRRTLADGGTDNGAFSWFMAKALLAEDPALSEGILRMLNESGTDALDLLTARGMDQARAAECLLRLLPLTREEAEAALREEGVSPEILEKTHPENPSPLVLVLNTELLSKTGSLSYFGFWNPETKTQEDAVYTQVSLAAAPLENGQAEMAMSGRDTAVVLRQDPAGVFSAEYTRQGDTRQPSRLCVWENGVCVQDERQRNGNRAIVAVLEDGKVSALLCSENLCGSLLVRLLAGEDRSIPQARFLGTWYAGQDPEGTGAQNRIFYGTKASWVTQAWEIGEN